MPRNRVKRDPCRASDVAYAPGSAPVQVDQRQLERVGRRDRVEVQQEMADVEIAVIDTAFVHASRHCRHTADQRAF